MIIDIDVGNTQTKWRLGDQGQILSCGTAAGSYKALLDAIEAAFLAANAGRPLEVKRVRIACVRSSAEQDKLHAIIDKRWGVQAEFGLSASATRGITNSYALPETMGVDRWSAIIAAAKLLDVPRVSRPFCVVDAGSAMTLDFVSGEGLHKGGFIVPGFSMQVDSLLQGTDRVFIDKKHFDRAVSLANNTSDAVLSGVLFGMVGLIEKSVNQFSESDGGEITVLLTGGDAELIDRSSELAMQHQPDLVIDGLACLLPD